MRIRFPGGGWGVPSSLHYPTRPAWVPTQTPIQLMLLDVFLLPGLGPKRPGRGVGLVNRLLVTRLRLGGAVPPLLTGFPDSVLQ
jgi:hypothetical protein